MNKERFEHYLHLKRWTFEEDKEWLKSLPLSVPNHYGTTFKEYQVLWIESDFEHLVIKNVKSIGKNEQS